MTNTIADIIENRLSSPEMARDSLHMTIVFGEELEQACDGTSLDGKAIRERLIPFRHGVMVEHKYQLERLAELLRADATFTLADMYLSGSNNMAICKAAAVLPGCTLSLQLRGKLFEEDIGM